MNVLVLGIGNLLLQDEGAGVRALGEFERRYETPAGVELLDGGTSGMELLHHIQGRDLLVILDVVRSGNPPGTVFKITGHEVPAMFQRQITPHQLGLSDLLAGAQLTGRMPEKMVLLGIEPMSIATGLKMSDEVCRNLGKLVDLLAHELSAHGLAVTMKSGFSDEMKQDAAASGTCLC